MSIGSYPTPAQAALYIGPWHIDDAYSVDFNWRSTTGPLFDYRKPRMVNAAIGKELVVGSLSINFRYPGYLFTAIQDTLKGIPNMDFEAMVDGARTESSKVEHYLDTMRTGDANDRIRLLLSAASEGPKALRKVSSLAYYLEELNADILTYKDKSQYLDVFDAQYTGSGRVLPVDIWLHYGNLDENHLAKVIKNVVFTGKSEQSHAGAMAAGGLSASGINVLEVYSFFAETVESFVIGAPENF